MASRLTEEQLVDANSKLTTEGADARQTLRENKVIIEALQRDVKSFEVLQPSLVHILFAQWSSCEYVLPLNGLKNSAPNS